MLTTVALGASQSAEFIEEADFFRLMNAPYSCDITFFRDGAIVGTANGVSGGYAERFKNYFDKVRIVSSAGQSVQFVMRLGNDVRYDVAPTGAVSIANVSGNFANTAPTVTNVDSIMLAASVSRRYIFIQNNDNAGNIFIKFGAAATSSTGVKIPPGGVWELQGFVPINDIHAIGDIASNANVIVVAG